MKITSVKNTLTFRADDSNPNFDASEKKKKEKKYVDPLANWPMRGLGYTNDIGVAINEIAPTTARLFWVPALMYFGADVYDKYKNKGNKYDPNAKRAFSQAVFQAFASIILPTVFGHIGQSAFSQLDKYKGNKISTNAKEQTLRFIDSHIAEHDIFKENRNKDEIINKFINNFDIFYQNKKNNYQEKNIKKQFTNILDNCKTSAESKKILDNKIFKLKAWKSLGAFTALLLTVKPIDVFVENIIIKKFVEPQMERFNFHTFTFDEFAKTKPNEDKA